jgi:uncharacterized protein YlxP (DUF503 family)
MVVLVQTWDLHLEGCQSLKERRAVLQPLKASLRRLNLAVAEIDHQDRWQRAGIAAATLGSERRVAEEILREADRMIEAADGVRVIDTDMRVA